MAEYLRLGGIYAKYYEYDSKPGTQQLMGVHKVSAFHPFIFQKSRKSTIIRNLAVPRHFVSYLVFFFSSIHVDPWLYIVTSPENTYPRGKHGEIKVHRSNACVYTGKANINVMCNIDKNSFMYCGLFFSKGLSNIQQF